MLEILACGGLVNSELARVVKIRVVLDLAASKIAYIFAVLGHREFKAEARKLKQLSAANVGVVRNERVDYKSAVSKDRVGRVKRECGLARICRHGDRNGRYARA